MEHFLIASLQQQLDPGVYADETPWQQWLHKHFANYITAPFAPRHVRFWEWVNSLQPKVKPRSRVECWPRGGGKSSTIELGCTYIGAAPNPVRHYVLYVCETQEQANLHVAAVGAMLERVGVKRAVNQYGASKGWKITQIRTANGFNMQAFGLDAGMRGIKLDEFRPDVIVFDDIDGRHDSELTTKKKIDVITTTVLPAGSTDCAVIVVQNKIAKNSIVSQLCDGRADFLHDRIPATVEPAVVDLQVEQQIQEDGTPRYVITGGTATWDGQSLETCEHQINEWGLGAFRREAQHEVDEVEGGLWDRERDIEQWRQPAGMDMPQFDRIVVAIDPSGSSEGDETGIAVAGIAKKWKNHTTNRYHAYVLDDRSMQGSPKAWAEDAARAYHQWQANAMIAEKNFGGDMVAATIATIPGAPHVTLVWASRGKMIRAEPVHKLYEDGLVHHVRRFDDMERELCTWVPGMPSPNRLDAIVWALTDLMLSPTTTTVTEQSAFAPAGTTRHDQARRIRRLRT